MPKLRTERILMDKEDKEDILDFKYDIYVDKEGLFSTTLPPVIVDKFIKANIDLKKNRMSNPGYLCDKNIEKLVEMVKDICKEYFSRERISHKIVIRYVIKTSCAYCLDIEGNIVPNARKEWTRFEERPVNDWRHGTETQHATSPLPFGMEVYAKPYHKNIFRYKSGKEKIEYDEITTWDGDVAKDKDKQYNLHYLQSIGSIAVPKGKYLQEIEYNESTAKFFVDIIRGICLINEKIKQFSEPDAIIKFLQDGGKLKLN